MTFDTIFKLLSSYLFVFWDFSYLLNLNQIWTLKTGKKCALSVPEVSYEDRCTYSTQSLTSFKFRGLGYSNLVDHGNWFYGVFWQRTVRSISCFLPHQEILILTKFIADRRLALMCNSIACANFNRDFLKMAIFQTSIPYWAYSFHGIILKLGRH